MTSKLTSVRVDLIDANPWRNLKRYPFVESKVDALVRSIKDVGLWEGIIVRKVGSRYQLAFGHHRWRAAKKARLKTIPVIVRDLDDADMVRFMGRENLEDWHSDFSCMLESWEAGADFFRAHGPEKMKDLAIATELGWTTVHKDGVHRMTKTAKACAAASALVAEDYLSKEELDGLSVRSAYDICSCARARMDQLERHGQEAKRPKRAIEQAKHQVAKGAKRTVEQVRAGRLPSSNIRAQLDINTWSQAAKAKKRTVLFEEFGRKAANAIDHMLDDDPVSERLAQILTAIDQITEKEDARVVARIRLELEYLKKRVVGWEKDFDKAVRGKPANKVIQIERKRLMDTAG
jgi:ParB/RepB/Spo0J family partition protein